MRHALSERDLRALHDVLGEVAEIGATDPGAALDRSVEFLRSNLGECGVWWTLTESSSAVVASSRVFGVDDFARRAHLAWVSDGNYEAHPMWDTVLAMPRVVVRREQIVPDDAWYRTRHVTEFSRLLGFDDVVAGHHPVLAEPGGTAHDVLIVASRPWGERRFTARDAALIDALQVRLGWLHRRLSRSVRHAARDRVRDTLPPRLRRVLDGLLGGGSEKELAHELGLSARTVHKYVEAVYERFGVRSRPELMALWVER